jgi:type IV secretory pathway VirB10-like protein
LQHPDDRPVRGGRPSLLSPDEQAAPERQGILSSLDGMPAQFPAAQGPRPRSRGLAWGLAAVGAIVVGGALFLWGGGEQRAPAVAVAAVADVPRAAPVTPVALPAPAAPAPAVLREEPAAPDVPMANPLAEMAAPPAPERRKTQVAKAEKAERKEAHAKAAHRKAHETATEKRAKPRAEREPDSDVVLLAALMSHIDPASRKATPAQQLEACRRYNAAGEEQCRARVCEKAGRKEAACKRVPVARSDPEA